MDVQTRQTMIARYKDGYRAVTDALAGATEAELDARPAPEKWTARESTAELLDRLADGDWSRQGVHPEHETYGVEKWMHVYAAHAHDHADQIRRARASARQ
jgi:hypothetical protein